MMEILSMSFQNAVVYDLMLAADQRSSIPCKHSQNVEMNEGFLKGQIHKGS